MNLQGMTFTEQNARDYYGNRFDTAELVWVTIDKDGQVVEGEQFMPGSPGQHGKGSALHG
jgi:hypothetical protein